MNNSIVQVLTAFCTSMYIWETACMATSHLEERWSGDEALCDRLEILLDMQEDWLRGIYRKFCLPDIDPGEDMTIGDPPEYDPEHFEIQKIAEESGAATAEVRQALLHRKQGRIAVRGHEVIEYHLRQVGSEWRLENRRTHYDLAGNVVQDHDSL